MVAARSALLSAVLTETLFLTRHRLSGSSVYAIAKYGTRWLLIGNHAALFEIGVTNSGARPDADGISLLSVCAFSPPSTLLALAPRDDRGY